jgi:hypothetical protein
VSGPYDLTWGQWLVTVAGALAAGTAAYLLLALRDRKRGRR